MYSEEHMDNILSKILYIWKKHPTMELGRLIDNATSGSELQFIEDEELIKNLERRYLPREEWDLKWNN